MTLPHGAEGKSVVCDMWYFLIILLALVCDVSLCFCHFPMWYPRSGVEFECIDS